VLNQKKIKNLNRMHVRFHLKSLKNVFLIGIVGSVFGSVQVANAQQNPVFQGWYADPEGIVYGDKYWIFPTFSAPYNEQIYLDAFSSTDLVNWTKHHRIIDTSEVKWAKRAMWAPAVLEKGGKYYLFFGANDVRNDEIGGIGVAVADKPEGPYKDLIGKPLINENVNGAQPIDQYVFKDVDGSYYMYYGGWRHCNVVKLKDDFTGIQPFPDGSMYKEVTPEGYVEGPFMFMKNGKYYFMWSEGGWGLANYKVAYAIADSPFGPFERIDTILEQDPEIATGAGHHSIMQVPGQDKWLIVYHRRPLGLKGANERVTCIDELFFDENGRIKPVKMTHTGVRFPISPQKTKK
jgi:beta-xylosidase